MTIYSATVESRHTGAAMRGAREENRLGDSDGDGGDAARDHRVRIW